MQANQIKSLSISPQNRYVKDDETLNITIGGENIKHVSEADYLGLRIDDCLSWKSQINKLCKCMGIKIAELKHMKKSANKEMFLYFHHTYIEPVIDYGLTIWSRVPKKDLYKIQKLQNACARIITGNYDYGTKSLDIIKSLKWMNIAERSRYFTCILVFKCVYNLAPVYLQTDFLKERFE